MSTHSVPVIRVAEVCKHPNADNLDIVPIWGFTVVCRRGQYKVGDLAVYVEPDYILPDSAHPHWDLFSFLGDGPTRIKAKRLRGVWSQGLLLPALPGMEEGDNVMDVLGIVRYVPKAEASFGGDCESPHASLRSVPKYDLENWRKFRHLLVEGEEVSIREKIHGTNARFAFRDGRMWVGSRTQWKSDSPTSVWWNALRQNPWIGEWCSEYQDFVLYGEVYGWVQDLRYGANPGELFFAAFDVLLGDGFFMDAADFVDLEGVAKAPLVYHGPYRADMVEELSRGDSYLTPKQLSEGIVIKPARERFSPEINDRVALKLVSDRYLERS